jgi:hypothetical protein
MAQVQPVIALLAVALAAPLVPPLADAPAYQEPVAEECPILSATSHDTLVRVLPCDGLLLPTSAYRHLRRLEVDADYARGRWAADVATLTAAYEAAVEREAEGRAELAADRVRADRRERAAHTGGVVRGVLVGGAVGLVAGLVVAAAL